MSRGLSLVLLSIGAFSPCAWPGEDVRPVTTPDPQQQNAYLKALQRSFQQNRISPSAPVAAPPPRANDQIAGSGLPPGRGGQVSPIRPGDPSGSGIGPGAGGPNPAEPQRLQNYQGNHRKN